MRPLTPTTIAAPLANYAHGIEVPAGARMIRTSGQLGLAADGSGDCGSTRGSFPVYPN